MWLSDRHITFALNLLKQKAAAISGLKDVVLPSSPIPQDTVQHVQVINVSENHWIVISLKNALISVSFFL